MGHTYTTLLTHIIFSTNERIPYLRNTQREDVFAYIGGTARRLNVMPLNIGGHDDHVHILARIPAAQSLADVVRGIKANSSRWIRDSGILHHTFAWQQGYAAFSVSESCAVEVGTYISRQDEHHQKMSFQAELITFLKRNRIEYDEGYIWS